MTGCMSTSLLEKPTVLHIQISAVRLTTYAFCSAFIFARINALETLLTFACQH